MRNLTEIEFECAPCLRDGAIAENGRRLVSAAQNLGESRWASVLRAWCVPYLFGAMEDVFASSAEPNAAINNALERLTNFLEAGVSCAFPFLPNFAANGHRRNGNGAPIEEITGEHYGQLFKQFSDSSYWDEPARLLRERLERNGISLAEIEGKTVVDVGCGGGRYSVAWRLLGAKTVVGYDVSATGIADARRRVEAAGIDGVTFQEGNVLSLPFADDSFDIVYSNGVLHHTVDWKTGVAELVRVLKPEGLGWLYLIENPGGLFWDLIEILRVILDGEDKASAREALKIIGVPANRIFYMLDHVLVPINVRLTPSQIENCLKNSGAANVRRLRRGADFDRVEQIFQNRPYAEIKYGVGENRYVFSKPF
jgi:ubiquinone/menaquinone biosynthesis C-methylase UbiE